MTATASKEEQEGIPHHLLSFLDVSEQEFNVLKFRELANKTVEEVSSKNKQPIIVGGTNYYMESLIFNSEDTSTELIGKRKLPLEMQDRIDKALKEKSYLEVV